MNTPAYSGIITSYACTAACRHCMFASSPDCPKEFLTAEKAEELAALLEKPAQHPSISAVGNRFCISRPCVTP